MSKAEEAKRWRVILQVESRLKPTQLAIAVNMLPGVVDAFILDSKKVGEDS